jgi:hypothetical protein
MHRSTDLPEHGSDPQISIPMLEDISVQFVQNSEDGFEWVTETQRQHAETDQPILWTDMELIQQAFRNLKDHLGENLQLSTLENGLVRIVSGGKYEASFLLLGNLWLQLEEEYGANLYAAVPSHNLLLIGKQGDPTAILELQETIRSVFFEADREALLSKAVYQRLEGEWKIVATAF